MVSQKCNDSSGGLYLYSHHDQQENDGDQRAVYKEQHRQDHHERDNGDLDDRRVTRMVHIGHQRRRPRDIDLDPYRRSRPCHNAPDSFHRLVRQGLALVACKVHLDVDALTIGTLYTRRGEWVAPIVLDVLHMGGVRSQLANQVVVVAVCVITEGALSLQHHHRHAVGIRFSEYLTHPLHRLERRRGLGNQGYRAFPPHLFQ